MTDAYIIAGHGFMIVYSILSRSSLQEARRYYEKIKLIKDEDDIPIVLVGNKCDLEKMREVSQETGQALANEFKCSLYETSAKDRLNVDEAFHQAIREIRKYQEKRSPAPMNIPGRDSRSKKRKCVIL